MNRSMERRMSEAVEIKDPAVAVHLAKIEGRIDGLRDSSAVQGKQLDSIMAELKELTKGSSTANDASVRRVWEELDKRDRKWDERFEVLALSHETTRERVNRIFWFSSGVSAIATLLLGVGLWVFKNEVVKSDRMDVRLDKIELYLAGSAPADRPYH